MLQVGYLHAEEQKGSPNMTPHLLITEIVPDSTNVNGADGYEFIEVYNNTDQLINFKDYNFRYRYPSGPDNDQVWRAIPNDVWLQPGKVMVFWVMNDKNKELTIADFNSNYNTNLIEGENLVKLDGNSMSNSRKRSIVVSSNTGYEIVKATYNDGVDDTQPDKGIFYKYPEDETNVMVQTGAGVEQANPGSIEDTQVPESVVNIEEDTTPPTIENLTTVKETTATELVEISAESRDESLVKTFKLFYKNTEDSTFKSVNLTKSNEDSLYSHTLQLLDLLGSKKIEYYFEASDGVNITTSEKYEIRIIEDEASPRLNLSNGEIITGEKVIKGNISGLDPEEISLFIDGNEVVDSYRSLEKQAYFVFEGEGLNNGAQNAVTINEEILKIVEGISGFSSVIVPVSPDELKQGDNQMAIRAGDTKGPFFEDTFPIDRYVDDFDVRNVRLILADGTEIRDPDYSDASEEIHIGDETYRATFFNFHIPEEELTSKTYNWDTNTTSDGEHQITISSPGHGEESKTVVVDNSGPEIQTTMEEGKQYKGEFVIDVTVDDEGDKVKSVDVLLDGQPIEVPYETSSIKLAAGEHVLEVSAMDEAGNESKKVISFNVMEEMPHKPKIISPLDGETGINVNPELSAEVTDPTDDDLHVTFYQGKKYNVENKNHVTAYRNAVSTEPPQEKIPDGESALTEEEYAKIMSSNDEYFITDSTEKFPYLRFEADLEGEIDGKDMVELIWEGKSLEGRKVTMYAWNYNEGEEGAWVAIDSSTTETEDDFFLTADVSVEDFVRENKVDILIQDQIPPPEEYDYTFAWMTDTQFYTELWPDIYQSQVNWIRDNQANLNIDYVFHTGDIVNEVSEVYQWERADQYMGVLDGASVPYGVLAGNHDVDLQNNNDYTTYSQYFGEKRFERKPYYGDSYKDNRGHYDLISSNGNDYIMLYMGWGIEDEDIAWMNNILAQYPNRKAILSFHTYLTPEGTRSAIGERLYQEIVVPNHNVVMVLSGHLTDSELLTSELDDDGDGTPDRNVYQMLSNYQGNPEGGAGYMKLFHFDTSSGTVFVNSYSPYLDDFNYYDTEEYPDKDEFTIDLNLEPQVKRVATDYFEINVYSDEKIGEVKDVPSGEVAKMKWEGLEENTTYYWYASVKDEFGGSAKSAINQFTTGEILPSPENLRIIDRTDNKIELAWDPVMKTEDLVTYEIYNNDQLVASTENTAHEITELQADTEYHFTIKAKDQSGKVSQLSDPLIVKTLKDLSELNLLVKKYKETKEIKGPLVKQLENKLKQTEKFLLKEDFSKAVKKLNDLHKHVNKDSMAKHISESAKEMLNKETEYILESWKNK